MKLACGTLAVGVLLLWTGLLAGCGRSSPAFGSNKPVTGRASEPPVTLQVQWSPTNRYYYRVETTLYNDIIAKTKAVPVAQETILALEYSVQVAGTNSDGGLRIALEILSAALNLTRNNELLVSYDTDNRAFMLDDADLSETLRNIKGAQLTAHLSPSNTVEKLEGVPALIARIGANKSGPAKTVAFLKSASMLRDMLNDRFFRQCVDWSLLPSAPVRIGASWNCTRAFATNPLDGGSATADLTCTLKGWQERGEEKCAVIDFSGQTKGASRAPRGVLGWFSSSKPSALQGRLWHHPDSSLPKAMVCMHESSMQYSAKAAAPKPAPVVVSADTNAPPPVTAKPAGPVFTLATRQCTVIELLEVGPLAKP